MLTQINYLLCGSGESKKGLILILVGLSPLHAVRKWIEQTCAGTASTFFSFFSSPIFCFSTTTKTAAKVKRLQIMRVRGKQNERISMFTLSNTISRHEKIQGIIGAIKANPDQGEFFFLKNTRSLKKTYTLQSLL